MKARLLLAAVASIVLVPLGAGVAQASTPAPTGHDCHVSAAWVNNGTGPSVQITETGTGCDDSDVVSLKLWWTTSLDGNPISDQQGIALIRDDAMPVGVYVAPIPDIADGACFWQLDLAWGHAPTTLATPYGSRLIEAWHGGVTDCVTQPTTPPPAPSTAPPTTTAPPVTTTPAPVPSATVTTPPPSAAPTTSAVPTPAPTTHKPKPPVVHHKPKPKPTHHKPSPKPTNTNPAGGSGCVGSSCETPTPAPTTSQPPTLPFTGPGVPVGLLLGLAAGLIVAGTTTLLVLRSHP